MIGLLRRITKYRPDVVHLSSQLESEAVFRAVTLGNRVNCPIYITKVMSKSAADIVAQSRKKGLLLHTNMATDMLRTTYSTEKTRLREV